MRKALIEGGRASVHVKLKNLLNTSIRRSWESAPSTLEAVHRYRPESLAESDGNIKTGLWVSNKVPSFVHTISGVGTPVALHLMDIPLRVTVVTLEPTSTVNDPLSKTFRELKTADIWGGEVSENNKSYQKVTTIPFSREYPYFLFFGFFFSSYFLDDYSHITARKRWFICRFDGWVCCDLICVDCLPN